MDFSGGIEYKNTIQWNTKGNARRSIVELGADIVLRSIIVILSNVINVFVNKNVVSHR